MFVTSQNTNEPYLSIDVYGGLLYREGRTFVSFVDVK